MEEEDLKCLCVRERVDGHKRSTKEWPTPPRQLQPNSRIQPFFLLLHLSIQFLKYTPHVRKKRDGVNAKRGGNLCCSLQSKLISMVFNAGLGEL